MEAEPLSGTGWVTGVSVAWDALGHMWGRMAWEAGSLWWNPPCHHPYSLERELKIWERKGLANHSVHLTDWGDRRGPHGAFQKAAIYFESSLLLFSWQFLGICPQRNLSEGILAATIIQAHFFGPLSHDGDRMWHSFCPEEVRGGVLSCPLLPTHGRPEPLGLAWLKRWPPGESRRPKAVGASARCPWLAIHRPRVLDLLGQGQEGSCQVGRNPASRIL